jgi:hypothetical protein
LCARRSRATSRVGMRVAESRTTRGLDPGTRHRPRHPGVAARAIVIPAGARSPHSTACSGGTVRADRSLCRECGKQRGRGPSGFPRGDDLGSARQSSGGGLRMGSLLRHAGAPHCLVVGRP